MKTFAQRTIFKLLPSHRVIKKFFNNQVINKSDRFLNSLIGSNMINHYGIYLNNIISLTNLVKLRRDK